MELGIAFVFFSLLCLQVNNVIIKLGFFCKISLFIICWANLYLYLCSFMVWCMGRCTILHSGCVGAHCYSLLCVVQNDFLVLFFLFYFKFKVEVEVEVEPES